MSDDREAALDIVRNVENESGWSESHMEADSRLPRESPVSSLPDAPG